MVDYVQDYINLIETGWIEGRKYIVEEDYYKPIKVEIKVGKKIKQAIERHQKDMKKSEGKSYPYIYRPEEAVPVVKFIEMLPDPKSRQPMKLATFQKFIIGLIYGWRKKKDNTRRFRKAYISLARKNGKSLLVAGIALYELLFGKNPKASRQVVAAANTKDQAGIVYGMLKKYLYALRNVSPEIKKRSKITKVDGVELSDFSTMKPLSSDADKQDGLDVLCGIVDEYGEAKDDAIIQVVESSQSQQLEGLILIISTTTKNLNGPMHSIEYPFVEKLLNEDVKGEAYLALCWEMDSLSEVDNEENWIKSNPLFEIPEAYDAMMEHKRNSLDEYKGKMDLSGWLTKEMNFWVQSSKDSFVTKEEWDAVKAPTNYNIRGRKVYIGIDLARTSDMTAVSWIIPIEEEHKLLLDTHGFVSSVGGIDHKQSIDKIPYRQYEAMNLIHISQREDGLIDTEEMCDWIRDFIDYNDLQLVGIYYDPFMMDKALINLSKTYPKKLIEVPQKINYLSSPTRALRELIRRGEVMHTNNPLLNRAAYNAMIKEYNDSVAIDKQINRNKIDSLDAIINAMSDAQYHDYDAPTLQDLLDTGEFGFGY
ncbi:terminase large subunit [Enterococcus phage vB_Efm8_KEN21]